ncbi:MAG: YbaK/EbsC family protein [Chloroflexota bacterium]
MIKTKITDLFDTEGIAYRVLPHEGAVFTIEEAAKQRDVVPEEMVKSILLRDKKQHYVMACVPGPARLDPQAVRVYLPGHYSRLTFATAAEILEVTGYVQGAVAPLCLPDDVPVIFDKALAFCARVNISSGDPIAGLELAGPDLMWMARAQVGSIVKE